MLNIIPAYSRLKAKVLPPASLQDLASQTIEIEPGSTFEVPEAICLPGEFDRVTGFVGNPKIDLARLRSGLRREGPTKAYRLDDALMADFTVYCGDAYQVFRKARKRPILSNRPEEISEAQLCTTSCAQTYFGHFFHDSLPLEELAARRGVTPVTFTRKPWLHEPDYRKLFEREITSVSHARFRRLWIVDETTLNSGWISRFEALRGRLRSKVSPTGCERVFLMRGSLANGRQLQNEAEVADELFRNGFQIVQPEKETASTLATILCGAKIAVCVAGSAKLHALVSMAKGTTLVDIHLSSAFGTIGKLLCDSIQMRWGYVVAEAQNSGFHLDPARLLKTLDLIRT